MRAGSSVDCPLCGARFSSYGIARHRRSCGRRFRLAAALVMWGFALRGESAYIGDVYRTLSVQVKGTGI